MDLYANMLAGSAMHMLAVPVGGYVVWLQTTGLLAILACLLGSIAGQDWWTPVGRAWWRFCLLGPLKIVGVVVAAVFRALADLLAPAKKSKARSGSSH